MSAYQLEVTIRGKQGSGKSRLALRVAEVAQSLGFDVDHKFDDYFVGGTITPNADRPRILIAEAQPEESEPHRRWREHGGARHTAILLLITLTIAATVLPLFGVN